MVKKIIKMIECACGCKQLIPEVDKKNRPRKFIVGHVNNIRTYKPLDKIAREKISQRNKLRYKNGFVVWNKGIPCSDYVKECVRKANTGRVASMETRKKLSLAKGGDKAYNWKGGIYDDPEGYVWIKTSNPQLNTYHKKYAKRCNVVWYQNTGEIIKKPFLLHHKNGIKKDDRFNNLQKMNRSEHLLIHKGNNEKVSSIPPGYKPKGL